MLLAALSLLLVVSPSPIERFRAQVFDSYQRLFPLERSIHPVTIVAIDEHSLREFGQWPWPRTRVAELLRRILDAKPASIGLDLFFPEPDRFSPATSAATVPGIPPEVAKWLVSLPTNDSLLAEAITGRNVVLGISGEVDPDSRFTAPPRSEPVRFLTERELPLTRYAGHIGNVPVLDQAAAGRGLINAGQATAVVRRVPLIARIGDAHFGSLGLESLRLGLGERLTVKDIGQGLLELRFGEVRAVSQEDGTAWLRFSRHSPDRFVSAYQVMLGRADPELLKDKVVLVGITGLGLLDYKNTPMAEIVPGVEVHAQLIENLLSGVSLRRYAVAPRVEAAALITLGLLFIIFVPRLRAHRGLAVLVGGTGLVGVAGLVAFVQFGALFDPVLPIAGAVMVFGLVLVGALSEADRQRRVLREQAARVAGELGAAQRIQMGLLPSPAELFREERRFRVAALLEPARTVGGDFYDCFMVDARHMCFVVADVSGKGLPAAVFMASVKSHLKSALVRGGDLGAALTRAQAEIERENPEHLFVTAFVGRLDVETGALEYANAGHEPPYERTQRGKPERVGVPGGPPLCVIDDYAYPSGNHRLLPGEWLCVVTDGATEAMNPKQEFFGTERLKTALGWMPEDVSPEDLVRRLRDDVHRFADGAEPADDLTLLALRWEGNGVTPA